MTVARRLLKYTFVLLTVVVVAFFLFFTPRGIGCGHRTVLVSGRLVDANSGEPIPGAYVLSLAVRAWAEDTELIERYRSWNKELAASREDAQNSGGWLLAGSLNASTTTRADGTFVLVLAVPSPRRRRGTEPGQFSWIHVTT